MQGYPPHPDPYVQGVVRRVLLLLVVVVRRRRRLVVERMTGMQRGG
jgi:hypothetical protein